jgi:hypothetical protein
LWLTPAAFPSVASVQVVSVFSSFGFQWPVQLTKLFAASSMSTFNEQLMAPECSIGAWSFELKSVRACGAPWAAAAVARREFTWVHSVSVCACACVHVRVCVAGGT